MIKLVQVGIWDVSAGTMENRNIGAPSDGYYKNVELNIAVGANTGRIFAYFGKKLSANVLDNFPDADGEFSYNADFSNQGMWLEDNLNAIPENETKRFLVLHSARKKIRVEKGDLTSLQVFTDDAQTALKYYLTADFVPYKGVAITMTLNRSGIVATENWNNPLVCLDNIRGSHINVDWYIEDTAGACAGYLYFFQQRRDDQNSGSQATTVHGEIISNAAHMEEVGAQYASGLFLGKVPFSNQGKSIQKDVIPAPRDWEKGDLLVMDARFVTTEVTPTVFTVDISLNGRIMYGPSKNDNSGVWTDGLGYVRENDRVTSYAH